MSGFNGGRKAPNVSQYLANLNTITSPESLSPQNEQGFGIDDDMNLFTNTEFFDFDLPELHNADFVKQQQQRARPTQPQALDIGGASDSFAAADFKFPDFDLDPRFNTSQDIKSQQANGVPLAPQQQASPTDSSPSSAPRPSTGDKRKLDAYLPASPADPRVVEETARFAAEEDKRRRNTAASARFRVKKKQREQALEKTAKEMTDKVSVLEAKVGQLEMENKWLKGLIMEKNDSGDLGEMWRQFSESKQGRIAEDRKDGVGTA